MAKAPKTIKIGKKLVKAKKLEKTQTLCTGNHIPK